MKTSTTWICLLIVLIWVVVADAQRPSASTKLTTQLQRKLDEFVVNKHVPGATLAVVLKNGTRINLASGYADAKTRETMAVDSRMFCGSTGKTFVSAVALQLVSEGKLDLDKQAAEYFKSETDRDLFDRLPNSQDITVRSLMNHTSGLPRYIFQKSFLDDLKANPSKSRSPRANLRLLHGVDPLHPVGEGWAYSDTNYLVLGLIIEQITGKKYFDVAQERLLDPLKLSNTLPATQPKIPGLIQGQIGSANPFGLPEQTVNDGAYALNPEFEWCGGGYVTTAGDLADWLFALHSGNVLKDQVYAALIQPVDFATGQPAAQGYGLGTFVWQTDQGPFYGHAGIMPGYLTQIEYSSDHRFAIAFQVNCDEGMGRGLHEWVQESAKTIIQSPESR